MHEFVAGVKQSLAQLSSPIPWRRVSMPGLAVAWAGMNVPSIETGGRPWVWEVVTPRQYDTSARLQEDPMVLAVQQDAVMVDINHDDHSGPIIRMQVPVSTAPDQVMIPQGPDPTGPWHVALRTGWTVRALGDAAQCWIDRETEGGARLDTPEPTPEPTNLFALQEGINYESAAFDRLLTLHPDEAAMVTSLLAGIHEALEPYR